ncbi:hypothetical protein DICPUDRAFT_148100 [Dictyostelium purpureum]|uniref:Peroxin-12 n=1 Tax=Dictyostelium purpureum TaxID=5786 RepID=F0ZA90_DICPU|nr:uncharacterized protein DICPUDRAFT_148100 [Dictyostelium purpureum]EGC39191.1 hypothetical protein DICPUDRAFT_148100 [Dictyostelium purpureum]|eukprot:XP_003284337.1 hypothetical protein DICPUDRAFT_148100 [Dictyostelium purpureum]
MFLFNFDNGDPNRPSFFEMLNQFQMMPSFKPALKYIFTVLSQRNPKLRYIVNYYDECFYSLLLLLEYHYLKYYEGSFSENFYNLKRIKSSKSSSVDGDTVFSLLKRLVVTPKSDHDQPELLTKSQILKKSFAMLRRNRAASAASLKEDHSIKDSDRAESLIYLVVIPYIKSKLDEYYKKESDPLMELGLYDEDNDDHERRVSNGTISDQIERERLELVELDQKLQLQHETRLKIYIRLKKLKLRYLLFKRLFGSSSILKKLKTIFLKVYPFVNAIYEALFFIYQLLYLYEYTNYYTPFFHLQSIQLKRLNHKDIESHRAAISNRRRDRINFVRDWYGAPFFVPLVSVLDSILDYSKYILPLSVFIFKSLEWWYSENRITAPTLPIPTPPTPAKRAPGGLEIPKDKKQCPLCSKERTNPTICGSGFVFCYPCIFGYVNEHSKCPITFLPTNKESLRKIYETV